jgi:hypothetical protein
MEGIEDHSAMSGYGRPGIPPYRFQAFFSDYQPDYSSTPNLPIFYQ